MDENKTMTLEEAHQFFAMSINGRVWELLQKPDRSQDEDDEMLYAAYASAYYWLKTGTAVHRQRGEWLISRVHVVLNHPQDALRHAQHCFQLTEAHQELMSDFDIAYGYEGLARAYALSGSTKEAREYFQLARQSGNAIQDSEDKSIFLSDFEDENWFGLLT